MVSTCEVCVIPDIVTPYAGVIMTHATVEISPTVDDLILNDVPGVLADILNHPGVPLPTWEKAKIRELEATLEVKTVPLPADNITVPNVSLVPSFAVKPESNCAN